jgi:hypothetical protein
MAGAGLNDEEQPLGGGTITPVVKVGSTIRRMTGPWSARVHELLQHLERVGFDGAPRYLGVDDRGREILSHIDGDTTADSAPAGVYDDAALVGAARLLRRLHDATVGFGDGRADGWQTLIGAPTGGPVICHNEIGPYNAIYRAGLPVAFIDWDFAAPGPREWDVAYALWRFVPLYSDNACVAFGSPVRPRGPRIRSFLDAYGLDDRSALLEVLRRRQDATRATMQALADRGDPAYARLVAEGRLEEITANMAYADRSHDDWAQFLR